jgi:predicted O-methyltransferase YrrM
MKATTRFQSGWYRALAQASHAIDPGTWPYFAERIRRRLLGDRPLLLESERVESLYGIHVVSLTEALRNLGLPEISEDPRKRYAALFAEGERRIACLGVPFQSLSIAGEADVHLIHSVACAVRPRRVLETGVALGWSSLVLLKAVEETGGHLVSVDLPYPFLLGSAWVGIVVPMELRKRWTLIKKADSLGLPLALRTQPDFDLIHYDSDKSAAGRRWAYPLLWSVLRPGGVLISDDVGDNEAWAEFCREVAHPMIVVRRSHSLAGILRKPCI